MTVKQMLGCGAHVRKIALSHVRCACGSACGSLSLKVRAKCVHVDIFQGAMCDRTFFTLFQMKISKTSNFYSHLAHFTYESSLRINEKILKFNKRGYNFLSLK